MHKLEDFHDSIDFVLTDIDDTLTDEGLLGPEAFDSLWKLHRSGVHVVPVTGRPAGWCEMIARQWPVSGVVGENGGFYFRYHDRKMHRQFFFDEKTQSENRAKLNGLRERILREVPGCAIASDQFTRLMDLAVDFCEDVPRLPKSDVQKIVSLFEAAGAHAKVSSIHVNGWFGSWDKLATTRLMMRERFGIDLDAERARCVFVGDSPNDAPMFAHFPNAVGVANVLDFRDRLDALPAWITRSRCGAGFAEVAQLLIDARGGAAA